jgi:hypothetical protein
VPHLALTLALSLVLAGASQEERPREPSRPLILRGATLHSMLPGDPPRVVDVLIEGGRIRALGDAAASASDPQVLELAGKHLVPGLIDAHVNFDPEHDALYLASGVTLVRDLGGDHLALQLERLPERRERVPGPTLLTAGAPLDGDPPAAASAVVLRSADAAEAYLPILFEEGVDFLSILPGLPEEVWRKTLTLAHARGLSVFGPRPARASLAEAVSAGQDGFHALDALLPPGARWNDVAQSALDEALAVLAQSKKPLVPLLYASALRLEDQDAAPSHRALLGLLAPSYEAWWRAELSQRRPYLAAEHRAPGELALERQARALLALFETGARLVPGSGAPQPWCLPGTALHQELRQWVRAGIPTRSVLELATRGAAEALGLAGQRGTLEEGAFADVLVLDQDPSADLALLLDPAWVIVRGRPLARAELEARLGVVGERQAALRAELSRPPEVAPPPQGEEGVVLLEGTVQSDSFGVPLSTERYRVVRLDDEVLLYTARLVYPAASGGPRELTLEQRVRGGRLEGLRAVLTETGSVLEHEGLWTANSWRMQSRLNGKTVSTPKPLREQPACIEAGSVTALLILARAPLGERVPVVQLHPGFDAEAVNWRVELDEQGNHRIRTQLGYRAFGLDEIGALAFALTKVGAGLVETRKVSASAFGGPGLPLPEEKRVRGAAGERRASPAGPGG